MDISFDTHTPENSRLRIKTSEGTDTVAVSIVTGGLIVDDVIEEESFRDVDLSPREAFAVAKCIEQAARQALANMKDAKERAQIVATGQEQLQPQAETSEGADSREEPPTDPPTPPKKRGRPRKEKDS